MIGYMKKLLCIIALALDVLIRLAGIETNLKTNAFMRLVVLSPNLFTSKSLDNGLVEVTSMTSWHVGGDAMDQSPVTLCCSFHRSNYHSILILVNNTFNLKKTCHEPWLDFTSSLFGFYLCTSLDYYILGIFWRYTYINSAIIYRCYVANYFFCKGTYFFLNLTLPPRKISFKKNVWPKT